MNPISNLVLTGMPGCGKSTLGVLAAKALGRGFVDTDLLLQSRSGLLLSQMIVREGRKGFLAAENRLLAELSVEQTVISTGGSAVYHEEGMRNLKANGLVVWIDVSLAEIERRLGDIVTRGVVLGPGQSLADLYHERRNLYETWADFRLEVIREDLERTVGRLVDLVKTSIRSDQESRS